MARTKQSARKRLSQKTSRKRKPAASDDTTDDGFIANDSDASDRPSKRTKSTSSPSLLTPQVDSEGSQYWEITKMRRVTISQYKGKNMVSIREYYEQGGKALPGKKGISMPMDQYAAFVELLPQIEKELSEKGEKVPRPQYDGVREEEEDVKEEVESESADGDGVPQKSNIEATSDEEED